MELSDQEKTTLLEIAKRAIIAKAGNREMPKLTTDLPILKEKRGAFVTLKKRGHLRGCIGYIKAVKPLGETVQEMAVAAAFHDPRFPSVKSEEIRDLSFEISVLSPLQRLKILMKLRWESMVFTLSAVTIPGCSCRKWQPSMAGTGIIFERDLLQGGSAAKSMERQGN